MSRKSLLRIIIAWVVSIIVAGFIGAFVEDRRDLITNSANGAAGIPPNAGDDAGARSTNVDIPSLIAKARQTIVGQPAYMDHFRTGAVFIGLNEEQVKAALAEVQRTMDDPEQKGGIYMRLLNRWAELNGEAAMSFAATKLKPEIEFDSGLRATVFTTWALREPEAAWRWYQQHGRNLADERVSSAVLAAYFRVLASRDVEEALAKLEAVEKADRPKMLNSIAYSVGSNPARLLLLQKISTLSPEEQLAIRKIVVTQWTISRWPAAEKWINSLPPEERKPLQKAAANVLFSRHPLVAAELLLESAGAEGKSEAYGSIATGWGYQDAAGFGEWLKKQPQGPGLDLARGNFARTVMVKDPAAAMAWAKSIQDDAQRSREVRHVLLYWRETDSASAEAAMDTSGLPPEEIKRLRQSPRMSKP